MLEPQGTFFFFLLVLAFGGLVTWLALTKHVVFRVLAAFLAFIPAAVWRAALPALLRWMTPQLTAADQRVEILAAHHQGAPRHPGRARPPTGQPTPA